MAGLQMWDLGLSKYWRDLWNIFDQLMFVILVIAIILRFTLTNDSNFIWARNVYAVDLVLFILRILELYLLYLHLGPKIVMIWRMVSI